MPRSEDGVSTDFPEIRVTFSDFFSVKPRALERYGALDVSLISDIPLFVDPFLLFNSQKPLYRKLHQEIISYLKFLRDKATDGTTPDPAIIRSLYAFPEVTQTWLGFTKSGNRGRGLGPAAARRLRRAGHP